MEEKKLLRIWLHDMGYKWIGEKHPTHPVRHMPVRHFTEEEAKREIASYEKDGYVIKPEDV